MSNLLKIVSDFLEMDNWPFAPSSSHPVIKTGFQGDNGKWTCLIRVLEDEQQVAFYSILPLNVPDTKRPELALFLTAANYGIIIGNFEMDLEDGEVRYKTSLDVDGAALTPELLRAMVYNNVGIMDKYFPGIMAVVYGDKSIQEALNQIEGEDEDEDDD